MSEDAVTRAELLEAIHRVESKADEALSILRHQFGNGSPGSTSLRLHEHDEAINAHRHTLNAHVSRITVIEQRMNGLLWFAGVTAAALVVQVVSTLWRTSE